MAIKPPGAPGPGVVQPPLTTERVGAERVVGGFAQQVHAAPAPEAAPPDSPVVGVVADVAAEIRAGKLERTGAVDAVIERLVVAQLPEGDGDTARGRERIALAQLALGDNPGFVARLDRLLASALGEAP